MQDSDEQQTSSAAKGPPVQVGEVYRDLLSWGVTLPRWQQELLRRILRAGTVSETEVDELATAAVSETEQQSSGFAAVSHADLPSVAALDAKRVLCGMKDLRNVNALRSDQTLMFGEQLTVVYGDNASGKSGYGRVLKKVYRARVVEQILGDVRSEAPSPDGPSATFSVKAADGVESTIAWKDGTSITGLGRFAVLDGACSVTYIRGGTLAVGPAGIDIPSRFADELESSEESARESRFSGAARQEDAATSGRRHRSRAFRSGTFVVHLRRSADGRQRLERRPRTRSAGA